MCVRVCQLMRETSLAPCNEAHTACLLLWHARCASPSQSLASSISLVPGPRLLLSVSGLVRFLYLAIARPAIAFSLSRFLAWRLLLFSSPLAWPVVALPCTPAYLAANDSRAHVSHREDR